MERMMRRNASSRISLARKPSRRIARLTFEVGSSLWFHIEREESGPVFRGVLTVRFYADGWPHDSCSAGTQNAQDTPSPYHDGSMSGRFVRGEMRLGPGRAAL